MAEWRLKWSDKVVGNRWFFSLSSKILIFFIVFSKKLLSLLVKEEGASCSCLR